LDASTELVLASASLRRRTAARADPTPPWQPTNLHSVTVSGNSKGAIEAGRHEERGFARYAFGVRR